MSTTIRLVFALVLVAGPLAGQSGIERNLQTTEMTREQLLEARQRLQDAAASPGYSGRVRDQARREAALISDRLEHGDLQVGDRIVLRVQGVDRLNDTLTVQAGRVITLREIGEIPLEGVLRSELQEHLEVQLARFVQEPVVRAQSLIRIAVLGAVGAQGFYAIPADALIEEAFMIAGGPAETADIDAAEVRRGDQVLFGSENLQQAIIQGRTLDQMNLRAGDRIIVPERTAGVFSGGIVRGLLLLVPAVTVVVTRFF